MLYTQKPYANVRIKSLYAQKLYVYVRIKSLYAQKPYVYVRIKLLYAQKPYVYVRIKLLYVQKPYVYVRKSRTMYAKVVHCTHKLYIVHTSRFERISRLRAKAVLYVHIKSLYVHRSTSYAQSRLECTSRIRTQ